jgi:hypothetical protein
MGVLFGTLGAVSAIVILTALIGGRVSRKTRSCHDVAQEPLQEEKQQSNRPAARSDTGELAPTR